MDMDPNIKERLNNINRDNSKSNNNQNQKDSSYLNHPFENEDELNEFLRAPCEAYLNSKAQFDKLFNDSLDGTDKISSEDGSAPLKAPIVEDDRNPIVSISLNEDPQKYKPIELVNPRREQSSWWVFLEMIALAVTVKFTVSYLLAWLGFDDQSWSSFILMHMILFPAGIFVGFLRLNNSFLTLPDLETSKVIQWKLSNLSRIPVDGTIRSPPFKTTTSIQAFSLPKLWHGAAQTCTWSVLVSRHKENENEIQLGLMGVDLHRIKGIGINAYFKINGSKLFIGYQPFKKPGDFGTTSFITVAPGEEIIITCQLQCVYCYA